MSFLLFTGLEIFRLADCAIDRVMVVHGNFAFVANHEEPREMESCPVFFFFAADNGEVKGAVRIVENMEASLQIPTATSAGSCTT